MESGGIYQLHQIWQHLAVPIWLIWQSLRIRHPLIFAPTKGAILRYIFRSRRFRQQQAAMRKQIDVTSWSPVVAQLHCCSLWQAAQKHQQHSSTSNNASSGLDSHSRHLCSNNSVAAEHRHQPSKSFQEAAQKFAVRRQSALLCLAKTTLYPLVGNHTLDVTQTRELEIKSLPACKISLGVSPDGPYFDNISLPRAQLLFWECATVSFRSSMYLCKFSWPWSLCCRPCPGMFALLKLLHLLRHMTQSQML